ncbi:MAG: glycosyltransferase [Alkalibacterium sp.]|nr:glycosyltransferase [Alkalibacterium sp.]
MKTLIYAFYELKGTIKNARLHILGGIDDESYYQECLELIRALKLEDVHLPGVVNVLEYERLDFTVLSSISEGQPLSVLESFAARRPCVTTDVGCCRELVEGTPDDPFGMAGFVVAPMHAEMMAEMEQLCKDKNLRLRMGENGRNMFRNIMCTMIYSTIIQPITRRSSNHGQH